jgi:hypothetical protein
MKNTTDYQQIDLFGTEESEETQTIAEETHEVAKEAEKQELAATPENLDTPKTGKNGYSDPKETRLYHNLLILQYKKERDPIIKQTLRERFQNRYGANIDKAKNIQLHD